jgi:ABC-type phosphate/phosphonate transport system substrate-binding protein
VGAIPSGTLNSYEIFGIAEISRAVVVVQTTPKIAYGGVVVTTGLTERVVEQLRRNFKTAATDLDLLNAGEALQDATDSDFSGLASLLRTLGVVGQ